MGKSSNNGKNAVALIENVQSKIILLRKQRVILDADVAVLYGTETRRVNEAVRNNAEKFPEGYMFQLSEKEFEILRSKISTANIDEKKLCEKNLRSKNSTANLSPKSRTLPKAFTEKGLYMLATILKSKTATDATFAIIETFAAVNNLKRELVDLHKETGIKNQQSRIKRFGEALSDIVMPDLETEETESSLELNFIIGKIKHTVKRIKKRQQDD